MRPTPARPWRAAKGGVSLMVRVTPRSSRDGVEAVADSAERPALKVRVRAVADKGEANRAVEGVVAEWLGVPKRSVALSAGGKSRIKTLMVSGEPARLEALLSARVGGLAVEK